MKIILVRHGDYDGGELNPLGIHQIRGVAEEIRELFPQLDGAVVFGSPLLRAKQSAEIIADEVGLPGIQIKEWLASRRIINELDVFDVVHPDVEVLIAVSHLPEIEDVLEHFGEKFGVDAWFDVDKGSAFLIDLEAKEIRKL